MWLEMSNTEAGTSPTQGVVAAGGGGVPEPVAPVVSRASLALAGLILSSGFHYGAAVVAGVISLRWIRPEAMGVWQIVAVAASYVGVIRFGVINGMNRELPFLLGRGDEAEAVLVAETALWHARLCVVLAASAAVVVELFGPKSSAWRWSVLGLGITTALGFYSDYALATCRGSRDFWRVGQAHLVQGAMAFVQPVLAFLWSLPGYAIYSGLNSTVLVSVVHRWRPLRVRPKLNFGTLVMLLRTGLPLWFGNYLLVLTVGLDRWVLLRFADIKAVGMYAPAALVMSGMAAVSGALGTYLYPTLSTMLGRGMTRKRLWAPTLKTALLGLAVSVPIVAAAWFAVPALVTLVPLYAGSVGAVRLAAFAGMFATLSAVTTLFAATKSFRIYYGYLFVVVSSRVALTIAGASYSSNVVEGVAAGVLASYALSGIYALGAAYAICRSGAVVT